MESLKNVGIALKTTPGALWAIAIGTLVFLIAKIYVFDQTAEIFPHAAEVGKLFQNLGEATLAALIFFVFSYQLPQVIEQRRIGPAVYALADTVVNRIFVAFDRVRRNRPEHPDSTELKLSDVTLEIVSSVFDSVEATDYCLALYDSEANMVALWIRSVALAHQESLECIAQMWRYSRFLDPEVAAILSEIEASEYSKILKLFAHPKALSGLGNLGFLSQPYFSVFGMAMRLAECVERLRKQYDMARAVEQRQSVGRKNSLKYFARRLTRRRTDAAGINKQS